MQWEFNNLQDMKDFCVYIYSELLKHEKNSLALEIKEFEYNTFTTSSEYLGELRITLKKVLTELDSLFDGGLKGSITKAIEAINKALNSQ